MTRCLVRLRVGGEASPGRVLVVALVFLLGGVVGLTAGCKPAPPPPPVAVILTVEIAVQDDDLIASGTTDLPDGTNLDIDVVGAAGTGNATTISAVVTAGGYRAAKDISGWSKGTLRATVWFKPAASNQPAGMADLFGVKGARLTGDNVVTAGGSRVVKESVELALAKSIPADPPPPPRQKILLRLTDTDYSYGYFTVTGTAENVGTEALWSPTITLKVFDSSTGKTLLADTFTWPAGCSFEDMEPGFRAAFELMVGVPGSPEHIRYRVEVEDYPFEIVK